MLLRRIAGKRQLLRRTAERYTPYRSAASSAWLPGMVMRGQPKTRKSSEAISRQMEPIHPAPGLPIGAEK